MNILGHFIYDLYGRLLYGSGPTYFDQPVYLEKVNNKYIPTSWLTFNLNSCDALSSYIIESQYIGRSSEVLNKLDYTFTSSRSETEFLFMPLILSLFHLVVQDMNFLKKLFLKN